MIIIIIAIPSSSFPLFSSLSRTSIIFHHLEGAAYGMSQGMIFFGYALAFRFGAFLVTLDSDHVLHAEFQDLFRVLFAIVFGAFAVGQASTFAPDYSKARVAANRVFALLDHVPLIDNYSTDGQEPVSVYCCRQLNFTQLLLLQCFPCIGHY